MPQKGTRVAPQIFTEARDKDVGPDRRNVPWSPENILTDTVAHLQRDLADMRVEFRYFRTPGVPPIVPTPLHVAFTSTKVPRFAGTTSLEQYRQVFHAIVLSNGWDDATAALQLLSHLEGDALNVALLVPVPRRASRVGLVDTLFVRGQADSSALIWKDSGGWRTIVWELGSLGIVHPSCYVARSFCLDVWQIKGLETVIGLCWADDILSLQSVSVCGTPVGVIAPVEYEILVIGLSDRVDGPMGCYEWLLLMSQCAWLWCHQINTRGAVVICPCVVGIEYKSRALTGSSSLDAVPVTESLLFYAPVCCLAICCAAGFSSWVLLGGCDCIWLAVFRLFSSELVWIV